MMMKISELKPGFHINEQAEDGGITRFEVINVKPLGRRIEVTFRSLLGMESALYQADGYLNAAHAVH